MRKVLASLFAFGLFLSARATTGSYSFTAFPATYTSIASSGTIWGTVLNDDAFATNVAIGFTFNYGGIGYSQLYASSNGYIALPNILPSSGAPSASNSLASLALLNFGRGIICPFWDDLDCTGRAVYTQTTGSAPNRVFTIEWANAGYYGGLSGPTADSLNFQVKLYETSNTIEFWYGRSVMISTSASGTIGIIDSTTDYVTLNNTSASPVSAATFVNTLATMPANGQVYRYALCTPSSVSITQSACIHATINGITYDSSGSYYQHYTSATGCDSVLTINLTVTRVDTSVATAGITLTSQQSGATYQWLDCDHGSMPIAGATSQAYSPSASGHYAVAVTVGSCSDTSDCKGVATTGVSGVSGQSFSVYPDPASNVLKITGTQSATAFAITDVAGRVLYQGHTQEGDTTVDVSLLSPGLYFLAIQGAVLTRWVKK